MSERTGIKFTSDAATGGITLFSPAKLNLFFRVLSKRADGYHEVASLYQTISLGDSLYAEVSERDGLSCTDSTLVSDSNTVSKARDLFRSKTGLSQKFNFHLRKRIPVQAGLGGGSGNAASALWAINHLCGYPVPVAALTGWAAELGSDVAFFFSKGTAYCEGRGEIVREVKAMPATSVWIAKPTEGLATPAVYRACRPEQCPPADPQAVLSDFIRGRPCYFNDLEPAAFELLPKLAHLKTMLLDAGFTTVTMTGSGTAFFCIGLVQPPSLADVTFFKADFIRRTEDGWY